MNAALVAGSPRAKHKEEAEGQSYMTAGGPDKQVKRSEQLFVSPRPLSERLPLLLLGMGL